MKSLNSGGARMAGIACPRKRRRPVRVVDNSRRTIEACMPPLWPPLLRQWGYPAIHFPGKTPRSR